LASASSSNFGHCRTRASRAAVKLHKKEKLTKELSPIGTFCDLRGLMPLRAKDRQSPGRFSCGCLYLF
jgi:hypothetical protein